MAENMTPRQEADCLAFLAQRASIKETAGWVGVSEWAVADLVRPCRRDAAAKPAQRRRRREEAA